MDQQTLIAKARERYEARMAADPRGAQAREIYNTVMVQHRQRMAASKPQPRHLHVVAHAGAAPQPTFQYATDELVAKVQAERHAREKVEAQARERVEANAEIMRTFNAKGRQPASEPQTLEEAQSVLMAKFTTPKPAALAIRAIKE